MKTFLIAALCALTCHTSLFCSSSKGLLRLAPESGLTEDEVDELAYFIDKKLSRWVESNGNYLHRELTELPRTIEYDPETDLVFIHLETLGGVRSVGKGSQKVVTKSILYNKKNPQIVATSTTRKPLTPNLRKEIATTKRLQGIQGIVETHAVTERKGENDQEIVSFISKLYDKGSLHQALKKGEKFSLQQKLQFAKDIIVGLHNMHNEGYLHRDLCPENVLIDSHNAVLADFGRTMKIKQAKQVSAEGHRVYLAPEAINYMVLEGEAYLPIEVFAAGATFYRLFYDCIPPWADTVFVKDQSIPREERMKLYSARYQNHYRKELKRLYNGKIEQNTLFAIKELTLKMIHPNPKLRPTTSQILEQVTTILESYQAE